LSSNVRGKTHYFDSEAYLELDNGLGSHTIESDENCELLGGSGVTQRVSKHQSA
jgi:hypothetical protein